MNNPKGMFWQRRAKYIRPRVPIFASGCCLYPRQSLLNQFRREPPTRTGLRIFKTPAGAAVKPGFVAGTLSANI